MTQASGEQQHCGWAALCGGLLAIVLALVGAIAQAESSPTVAQVFDLLARAEQWQSIKPLDFLPGRSNDKADALTRLRADYVRTPIYFEPNVGQTAQDVKFLARGAGYALFLTGDEAVLSLRPSRPTTEPAAAPMTPGAVIRTRLEGAARNPAPQIEGLEKLPGISNYLLGNDPAKWRTNVPHYQRVRYANVYPGIDLMYYGNPQQLEHDFIVAPGADPAMIQLAISGAERVRVNAEGDLVLTVPGGEVVQQAPRIYQVTDGQQQPVAGRYVLRNSEAAATTVNIAVADPMFEPLRVGFEVAHYDPKQPLVIDPVLAYSTFLGGIKEDYATSIAVDDSGFAYVTGATTSSLDFPITVGGYPNSTNTKQDAFVSRFNFNLSGVASLLCSTYLGGSSDDKDDIGYAIAVDDMGFAYVTGTTASANFPTVGPGTLNGGKDAFIVVLNTNCDLSFSTYWGGTKDDEGRGIAVLQSLIYVTGYTSSNFSDGFPLQNPFQPALLGGTDAFVSVIDTGGTLYYSTYMGGAKDDKGAAIAVDNLGHIYLTGSTASTNFPVTGLAFDTTLGGSLDGFIAKIDPFSFPAPNGRYSLLYSAYLGGSGADSGAGIAVDYDGHAYVTGSTASSNFPMTPNAAQSNYAGNGDVFVAKIDPDPTLVGMDSLLYSTYLGGSGADSAAGIAVVPNSPAPVSTYVTGATASANFPVTADAMDKTLGGSGDAFVAQLNDTGKAWLYVTYLGGNNGIDSGAGIAARANGVYLAGVTNANDFPFTPNGYYPINNNVKDAFVVKLEGGVILTVTPIGLGTVKSNVTGINCGTDCTETYVTGTPPVSVMLTAAPVSGWAFAGWSGACSGAGTCTVSMTAAKTVTATFTQYFATVGVFRDGGWYLDDNGNGIWDSCSTDLCMSFGQASDLPIVGDWNGSGNTKIGVFRAGGWYLDYNGNGIWDDCCFTSFGQAGDLPIVGDWNGSGTTKIGVFRPSANAFYLDYNGNGVWDGCGSGLDRCYTGFALTGDLPVVGDWNGDHKAKIGVFRNGQWFLDANGNGVWDSADLSLSFEVAGDKPVVGDWNGSGTAKIGVFHSGTWYLNYNGSGFWNGCGISATTDRCYLGSFGASGDLPVAGHW
ncbi:SBBP repeat-containing protein [Candidatus Contendibacter odensensis]|uniref:Bacterial repeat domain-containing protein n=1 Tax=Candidatus Contendobacter odensis Run_B_J11 TaxID=1400861 RepID=A0A7U7J396_9GAMM|nr:SBBP repeat-containing protein [Candidatus Contendobacter odensis]CDH45014.1 conserved exported hypothetical protein [Candidatus Contendobacter odensis Run_B_J11]